MKIQSTHPLFKDRIITNEYVMIKATLTLYRPIS